MTSQPRSRGRRGRRGEEGRVTAFVVSAFAGLLAMAGLVLDGGLALAAKVEAIGQAQEAARAGAQRLDLAAYRADGTLQVQPAEAVTAAKRYLDAVGATGTVTVVGNTVTVTITTVRPTQLLDLVGIDALTVAGTGSAQPHRGVTDAEP